MGYYELNKKYNFTDIQKVTDNIVYLSVGFCINSVECVKCDIIVDITES